MAHSTPVSSRTLRPLSTLAALAMVGALTALPAHGAQAADSEAPEAAVTETVSHVTGQDRRTGEAFSFAVHEQGGVVTVTATSTPVDSPSSVETVTSQAQFHQFAMNLAAEHSRAALDGTSRLGSASVYDTAVAISKRAWEAGSATTVYLTRADRTTDALAAGALTDGPILFVPRTGSAPASVVNEIKRLAPASVVALGGENAVSRSVLTSAAAGRSTSRLAGASSYDTAVTIANRAFPNGASEVYLAGLKQGTGGVIQDSPDAAAGGSLSKGPVLPVPTGANVPATITSAIDRLAPGKVYALGGTSAVTSRNLSQAAGSRSTARLNGADRYATSAAIAKHAFPNGANVAYLVAPTAVSEAVAGGSLADGPILFTPPAGSAYRAQAGTVADALNRLGVRSVGSLSPASALPAAAIAAVVDKAPAASTGPLPKHTSGGSSAPAPAPAPAPTPKATPAPKPSTPAPKPSTPAPKPSAPAPAPAPKPVKAAAPAPAPQQKVETCDSLIDSFRPIPLPTVYTISCADTIQGNANVLGLTTSRIYVDSGQVASGEVVISRNQSIPMMKATIAHELAHAYSYGHLTRNQRNWFSRELMKVDSKVTSTDFGGSGYDHMPAEQWARGQAACAGWPDPFKRPTASCRLINATIANRI